MQKRLPPRAVFTKFHYLHTAGKLKQLEVDLKCCRKQIILAFLFDRILGTDETEG